MVALAPVPSIGGEYGIVSMFNSPSVELVVDAVGGGNELLLISSRQNRQFPTIEIGDEVWVPERNLLARGHAASR